MRSAPIFAVLCAVSGYSACVVLEHAVFPALGLSGLAGQAGLGLAFVGLALIGAAVELARVNR